MATGVGSQGLALTATAVVFAVFSGAAMGGEFGCRTGSPDYLQPIRWSASADATGVWIKLGIRNPSPKEIVMVDAKVWFIDALSRVIGGDGLPIEPDFAVAANGANIANVLGSPAFLRLAHLSPDVATAHICTVSVLYKDGSKQTF